MAYTTYFCGNQGLIDSNRATIEQNEAKIKQNNIDIDEYNTLIADIDNLNNLILSCASGLDCAYNNASTAIVDTAIADQFKAIDGYSKDLNKAKGELETTKMTAQDKITELTNENETLKAENTRLAAAIDAESSKYCTYNDNSTKK